MPEHPTDAHFSFTFVFKQALNLHAPTEDADSAPAPENYTRVKFAESQNYKEKSAGDCFTLSGALQLIIP